MGFSCGLVGLPNVGKSTMFNAVTRTAQAAVANYPFCTIEPNQADVPVPDARIAPIAKAADSARIVPTRLGFADIAGLVRGASKGEGLGNRFLAHIREADAVVHVVRCFENADVAHVDGDPDPLRDAETVSTELMLADLERAGRHLESLARKRRGGDRGAEQHALVLEAARTVLAEGHPARLAEIPDGLEAGLADSGLLTAKPLLYVANVSEEDAAGGSALAQHLAAFAESEGAPCITIAAALEAEIAALAEEDRAMFLADAGLAETGLDRLVQAGYGALELVTYFTAGPKETCARTLTRGATALEAAGRIHTDFARGFIRAEAIHWKEFVEAGGEAGAREAGRIRAEGRDYVVADGDLIRFRFNV